MKPSYKVLSEHGGNMPAKLLDEAARRISFGEAKVVVVTGGEALASCEFHPELEDRKMLMVGLMTVGACAAAGKMPPPGWTPPNKNARTVSVSNVKRFGQSTLPEALS